MFRECSPPTMCHMSHVTGQVSHVTCHMSGVTCQVSGVKCQVLGVTCFFFFTKENRYTISERHSHNCHAHPNSGQFIIHTYVNLSSVCPCVWIMLFPPPHHPGFGDIWNGAYQLIWKKMLSSLGINWWSYKPPYNPPNSFKDIYI